MRYSFYLKVADSNIHFRIELKATLAAAFDEIFSQPRYLGYYRVKPRTFYYGMISKKIIKGLFMSKKTGKIPEDNLAWYDRLIATNPDIERKGKTMPYTSLNGHMFTYLSKTGSMGLRLPKEEREAFLEKYNTTLYESYGAVMKEYVTVPDDLLENTDELKKYLEISYEYIKTLKPKPTKKKS